MNDLNKAKRFLPLKKIMVAEIGTGIGLSYCGMQLSDGGSEVIKVEDIGEGDPIRKENEIIDKESELFLALNRGKKSLCLDFKSKQAKTILKKLFRKIDICLLTKEAAKNSELTYKAVAKLNSSIIYCSISSLGETGPYCDRTATELEIQGLAGYQWFLGKHGNPPIRLGGDICETITGMQAFMGILAALFYKIRHGKGQEIKISMLRAAASFAYYLPAFTDPDNWLGYMVSGPTDDPERGYKTGDKPILWGFGLSTPDKAKKGWRSFCKRIEDFSWMLEDPYWAEFGAQMIGLGRDAQENRPVFEATFENMSSEELIEHIDGCGGVAAPFNNYETLFRDKQIKSIELTRDITDSNNKKFEVLRQPWVFSLGSIYPEEAPPKLGQHSKVILEMLGYSKKSIDNLVNKKVVKINN